MSSLPVSYILEAFRAFAASDETLTSCIVWLAAGLPALLFAFWAEPEV